MASAKFVEKYDAEDLVETCRSIDPELVEALLESGCYRKNGSIDPKVLAKKLDRSPLRIDRDLNRLKEANR